MKTSLLGLFLAVGIFVSIGLAQQKAPEKNQPLPQWLKAKKTTSSSSFFWPLLSLAVVFCGVLVLIKKTTPPAQNSDLLQVIAQVTLSSHQKLALVQAEQKKFVIAINRETVEFLVEIDNKPNQPLEEVWNLSPHHERHS